jgi:hypothetical protein
VGIWDTLFVFAEVLVDAVLDKLAFSFEAVSLVPDLIPPPHTQHAVNPSSPSSDL